MSFLKEQFVLLRHFWGAYLPKFLRFSCLFFLVSAALGFFLGLTEPDTTAAVLESFSQLAEESGVLDKATGGIALFPLLENNWMAMLTTMVMGFIPFLLLPAVSLLSNGVLVGVLAGVYCTTEELGLGLFLAGILPHGIFEIPALLLSGACGVALCLNTSRFFLGRSPRPVLPLIEDLLRVLLLLVAPLTVAAAAVECYITPLILSLL